MKWNKNSLKSDFSISEELPVKQPSEENVQAVKTDGSVRMQEVKGHTGTDVCCQRFVVTC